MSRAGRCEDRESGAGGHIDVGGAVTELRAALELGEISAEAGLGRVRELAVAGADTQAAQVFYFNLARKLQAVGQALVDLGTIESRGHLARPAILAAAKLYDEAGRTTDAARLYVQALSNAPNCQEARERLAACVGACPDARRTAFVELMQANWPARHADARPQLVALIDSTGAINSSEVEAGESQGERWSGADGLGVDVRASVSVSDLIAGLRAARRASGDDVPRAWTAVEDAARALSLDWIAAHAARRRGSDCWSQEPVVSLEELGLLHEAGLLPEVGAACSSLAENLSWDQLTRVIPEIRRLVVSPQVVAALTGAGSVLGVYFGQLDVPTAFARGGPQDAVHLAAGVRRLARGERDAGRHLLKAGGLAAILGELTRNNEHGALRRAESVREIARTVRAASKPGRLRCAVLTDGDTQSELVRRAAEIVGDVTEASRDRLTAGTHLYHAALQFDGPNSGNAKFNLGACYYYLQRSEQATEWFAAASEAVPNDIAILWARIVSISSIENGVALKLLERLLEREPGHGKANALASLMCLEVGRNQDAFRFAMNGVQGSIWDSCIQLAVHCAARLSDSALWRELRDILKLRLVPAAGAPRAPKVKGDTLRGVSSGDVDPLRKRVWTLAKNGKYKAIQSVLEASGLERGSRSWAALYFEIAARAVSEGRGPIAMAILDREVAPILGAGDEKVRALRRTASQAAAAADMQPERVPPTRSSRRQFDHLPVGLELGDYPLVAEGGELGEDVEAALAGQFVGSKLELLLSRLRREGRTDEAIAAVIRLCQTRSKRWITPRVHLARLFDEVGDSHNAGVMFDAACRESSPDKLAWVLGEFLRLRVDQGRYDDAAEMITRLDLSKLEPKHRRQTRLIRLVAEEVNSDRVWEQLADVYDRFGPAYRGDAQHARQMATAVASGAPAAQRRQKIARPVEQIRSQWQRFFRPRRQHDRALQLVRNEADLSRHRRDYVELEVEILLDAGRDEEAVEVQRAFAAASGDRVAQLRLADLCARTLDFAGEQAAYERLLSDNPFDQDVYGRALRAKISLSRSAPSDDADVMDAAFQYLSTRLTSDQDALYDLLKFRAEDSDVDSVLALLRELDPLITRWQEPLSA